jgi:hypothetical protein
MSDELVYVGTRPDTLADGRPLANGDTVHLSPKQRAEPHNERLISDALLVERPGREPKSREPRKEAGSQ